MGLQGNPNLQLSFTLSTDSTQSLFQGPSDIIPPVGSLKQQPLPLFVVGRAPEGALGLAYLSALLLPGRGRGRHLVSSVDAHCTNPVIMSMGHHKPIYFLFPYLPVGLYGEAHFL